MQDEMVSVFIDHMNSPRNYGKLESYDGCGIGKNPQNGESVIVYFKLKDALINEIAYQVKACSTTVVSGSIFTDTVKGVSLLEAQTLTNIMLESLESVPEEEAACSEIVAAAFLAALEHYENLKIDKDALMVTKLTAKECNPEIADESK
ncbi:MAG: iron-sulfur cluster assembly scaffold protein [Campylobacterota bacterium]|nr:iron-sulfur cluster assembly scaffold protein [Campylobacterota bacterium]